MSPPKNVKWIADVPFDEINHNKRWQNPSLCFLKKQNRVEKTKTKLVFTPHVKTPFYTPLVKTPHFFLQILVKTCFVKITYANVRKIKKSKNKTELKRQKRKLVYQVALDLLKQNADGGEEHFLFADDHQLVNALSEKQKQTKTQIKTSNMCLTHFSSD